MPELPEVHTISTDLDNTIRDFLIEDIVVYGNYSLLPDNKSFLARVKGKKISTVDRIAKNIKFNLHGEGHFLIHLAMTGQVLIREPDFKSDKWIRVLFKVSSGNQRFDLRFCDMRMFGKVVFMDPMQLEKYKNKYGPEPIDPNTTPEIFHNQIKSKKTNIKNALLDQEIISGLGNIYATDALYISEIHPETPTHKLSQEQAHKLLSASKEILLEGIKHRGSTLDDEMYVDAFGKKGAHQNYFRIYGKKECPKCSSKVVFSKLNGRGTYHCPNCQTLSGQKALL